VRDGTAQQHETCDDCCTGNGCDCIPIWRRLDLRKTIDMARHGHPSPTLSPDELETLLNAYESGRFRS